uniref:toxin glutamine deamidase domain-containing protein n=1 Tax=Rhizobium rhizogenes TaxID=359 RepID=UPI0035ABB020
MENGLQAQILGNTSSDNFPDAFLLGVLQKADAGRISTSQIPVEYKKDLLKFQATNKAVANTVGVALGGAACLSGVLTFACAGGILGATISANHLYADGQTGVTGEAANTLFVAALVYNSNYTPEEAQRLERLVEAGVIVVSLGAGVTQFVRFSLSKGANAVNLSDDGIGFASRVIDDANDGAAAAAGSIRNVNPGFPNLEGRTENCVNCVIATDAVVASRPATALPTDGPQPLSVLENFFGTRFGTPTTIDRIQQRMIDAGNGARGIVFGSRGTETGHVFNVVNQGGTIRFLDGQSGGAANLNDGFTNFQLLRTN